MVISKVKIISKTELQLEEPANVGDIIDLNNLNLIDTSSIDEFIKKEQSKIILETKNETRENLAKQYQSDLNNVSLKYENTIKELRTEIENEKKIKEKEIENNSLKIKNDYIQQIEGLKKEKDILIQTNILEKNNDLQKQKSDFDLKIETLQGKLNSQESEKKNAVLEAEKEKDKEIKELNEKLSRFELSKSNKNIKVLGEDLEKWCWNEYQNYSQSGFENCTFEKINEAVKEEGKNKGTKADFKFVVYNDNKKPISSVCLEMKNESNVGISSKKKNSDHYSKLDKDRVKAGCEYALLVSELERNDNDVPILKVNEFPNMYRVRPQYFITFLSIVYSLAKKYADLILLKSKEDITFKEKEDILNDFEGFKMTYLDKPLEVLRKEVEDIKKASNVIRDSNDKIMISCNKICDDTLSNMKTKIERFDIRSIVKKIEKIEE